MNNDRLDGASSSFMLRLFIYFCCLSALLYSAWTFVSALSLQGKLLSDAVALNVPSSPSKEDVLAIMRTPSFPAEVERLRKEAGYTWHASRLFGVSLLSLVVAVAVFRKWPTFRYWLATLAIIIPLSASIIVINSKHGNTAHNTIFVIGSILGSCYWWIIWFISKFWLIKGTQSQLFSDWSRMISPQLYWVMTGDDFSLDINNPKEPKILCVGNNPDRQNIYSAALGLYNSRIVKLINKKGQLKSSVIIDELPTIYFRGLDNLIATARSNKVAVCLGFQDYSQLTRDYGDKESKVIQNTVGNIFSGQVVGETAKNLSERFGKVLQKRQSLTINRNDKSTSISTQLDSLIPASKISTLTQGMFVGAVADNFDERIEQKIFHAEIVMDNEKVATETKAYKIIPQILSFTDENGTDNMKQEIETNYRQVKQDIVQVIESELERIKNDPDLQHLVQAT